MARLLLGSREEAEDALQDVLLRLWTTACNCRPYQSVEALAVRITATCAWTGSNTVNIKRWSPWKRLPALPITVPPSNWRSFPTATSSCSASTPVARSAASRAAPARGGRVLYEEIEQVTGMNINNIRVILSRARKQVRESYLKNQRV
jgi:RNA polymerase sigma-70 factor (ECF subfamily)